LIEIPVQDIPESSVFSRLFHDLLVRVLLSYFCNQAVFIHDSRYFFVIHSNFLISQLHLDGAPAVFRSAFVKDLLDDEVVGVIFGIAFRIF